MCKHVCARPGHLPEWLLTQGRKMATCTDNVTDARLPAGAGAARAVTSYVCQAIVVPPDVMGYKVAVSSQPISLADRLVGELPRGHPCAMGTLWCHWDTLVPWGHSGATRIPLCHWDTPVPLGHPSWCQRDTSVP